MRQSMTRCFSGVCKTQKNFKNKKIKIKIKGHLQNQKINHAPVPFMECFEKKKFNKKN